MDRGREHGRQLARCPARIRCQTAQDASETADVPDSVHDDLLGPGVLGVEAVGRCVRCAGGAQDPPALPPGCGSQPARQREAGSPRPAAGPAEIVRIYGIRHRAGQTHKQVKDEPGWAGFQVRSDVAIRRHQALVTCASSFCWAAWPAGHPPRQTSRDRNRSPAAETGGHPPHRPRLHPGRERSARCAPGFPLDRIAALAAGMLQGAPAPAAAGPDQLGRRRLRPAPLHP